MTEAGNNMARGWMDMLAGLPGGREAAAWAGAWNADPAGLAQLQARYAEAQARLWSAMLAREAGGRRRRRQPGAGRQALCRGRVARQPLLRIPQAVLP